MDAKEAVQLSKDNTLSAEETFVSTCKKVEEEIKYAAQKGAYEVENIADADFYIKTYDRYQEHFESKGFKVSFCDITGNMFISWENS